MNSPTTGLTPLHLAVCSGFQSTVLELIQHGASVHARDAYGRTPLMIAALFGYRDIVSALLSAG
jgi:ankyrin repeat protein